MKKILIVEDEPITAGALKTMLTDKGYHVTGIARTKDEAINLTESDEPDLILMDIYLDGESDGIETAGIISQKHDIPVIYVTANSDNITFNKTLETNSYGFIVKPVKIDELIFSIIMALNKYETEKTIHEYEQKVRKAEEIGKVGFFFRNFKTNDRYWSDGASSIHGFDADELPESFDDFLNNLHPDDRLLLQNIISEATPENPKQTATYRVMKNDAIISVIESNVEFIFDNDNKLESSIGIVRDITGQYHAKFALEESEKRARAIMNASSDAIALLIADGTIIDSNEETAKRFGLSLDNFIGKNIFSFFQKDVAQNRKNDIDTVFKTGEPIHTIDNRSGRWFENNLYPIFNEQKKVDQVVVYSHEITDRIKYEEKIQHLTSELIKSQENERQHIARDLHDSIAQMILAAKLNINEYIKDPGGAEERLTMGVEFLDRAASEIKDIYTGLYPSILKDIGLKATIKWYADNYLDKAHIHYSLDYTITESLDHDISVNLYRIIQELISNIIKHSKAKNVIIEFRINNEDCLEFLLKDDGIGFNESQDDKVFQNFGLINVMERVKLFNGNINVISSPGKGTEFKITIPGWKRQ